MKFGGIGVPELAIILVVALLIFGPKNLPKLGSAIGKSVKNLREGMEGAQDKDVTDASDEVMAEEELPEEPAKKIEGAAKKAKKPASKAAQA